MKNLGLALLAILPFIQGCETSSIQKESKLITGKIINGAYVKEESQAASFNVFFMNDRNGTCSGSLIAPNVVLTAAHCLSTARASDLKVYVGLNVSTWEKDQVILRAKNIFKHPGWTAERDQDDLALIELESPVDPTYKPVAIFDGPLLPDFAIFPIEAYGYSAFVGNNTIDLTNYFKDIFNDSSRAYVTDNFGIFQLRGKLLPAAENSYKGAGDNYLLIDQLAGGICSGDSGGPMVVNVEGEKVQIAINDSIVSLKNGAIDCSSYAAATYVQPYLGWINETLEANQLPKIATKQFKKPEDLADTTQADTSCVYSQRNVADILFEAKESVVNNVCDKKLIADLEEYVVYARDFCTTELSIGYNEVIKATVESVKANCKEESHSLKTAIIR